MSLILLRHGRREGYGDVPLNAQGLAQAQELAADPRLQPVQNLLTSPKKRAQMTIEPLSQRLGRPITTLQSLDQMERDESEWAFQERVAKVLDEVKLNLNPTLICSHSDWLAVATTWMAQSNPSLQSRLFDCAQYQEFLWKDSQWQAV